MMSAQNPQVQAPRRLRVFAWGLALALFIPGVHRGAEPAEPAAAGFRAVPLAVGASQRPGFTLMPPAQTGVGFANVLPESRHITNQILLNGAGVAAGDVDGDGLPDLYLCATHGTNALYRNLGGWRFERVPQDGGAGCGQLTSTGAAFFDFDGDDDLDLVVNTLGNGTRVFRNDGKGRFEPMDSPLNGRAGGMTAAVGDVDGDGFLDLYVANYRTSGLMDMPNARATFRKVDGKLEVDSVNGRPVTEPDLAHRFHVGARGEVEELGEPDAFYRNLGGVRFELQPPGVFLDEDGQALLEPLRDWALSAMFRDVNADGLPDLYVCNDFHSPDRLWINQGEGRFRLAPRAWLRHMSRFSMAVDFADINRDGREDILVVDMLSRQHGMRMRSILDAPPDEGMIRDPLGRPQYVRNMLFLNQGTSGWAEMAHLSGVEASDWSWACVFLDVDLDGWEDILISNGMERAARDQDVLDKMKALRATRRMSDGEVFEARRMFPRLNTPNVAFRNRGDLTFEECGAKWGFNSTAVSQAMALADFDGDGDLDVIVSNLNAPVGLYRNESASPRIAVRLAGLAPNTRGIGARIRVVDAAGRRQMQEITAGGRYLAGDDAMRSFAAPADGGLHEIEVTWRSGKKSRVGQARANQLYVIAESGAVPAVPAATTAPPAPLFQNVSARVVWRHAAAPFNDFDRQPLLPWKLGETGPGVAWADLDGDGDEDIVAGPGAGGTPGVFVNDGNGGFRAASPAGGGWTDSTAGLAVELQEDGKAAVLCAVSHYQDVMVEGSGMRRLTLAAGEDAGVPAMASGDAGALALADVDGDGDLDCFVAGRVIPGRYPEAATSRLLRREKEGWRADPSPVWTGLGLVNGAVFTDVEGDGDVDLVVACEWGPLKLLLNEGGAFRDATAAWKLSEHTGWWTSVAAGDFDGDGRLDLAAGNWGRNTKYQSRLARPLSIRYGDPDGDGRYELIEGWFDPTAGKEVPVRQLEALAKVFPQLKERFVSNRAFGAASLAEVIGNPPLLVGRAEAKTLESAVFLNRGGHFERLPLPVDAQVSPANSVVVADADGDGREDLFLAQNLFGIQPEEARLDAGPGLWLLGDGGGGFRALSPLESGVEMLGQQRGSAVADFDGDGRIDLLVGQHDAALQLFRNQSGRPGLRVRLTGARGNRGAVGAAVRLKRDGTWGPVREVHAGSGSGAQDGLTAIVLGVAGDPSELEVRWPGGKRVQVKVTPGQREVSLRDGE
jgi:hypothetical protein